MPRRRARMVVLVVLAVFAVAAGVAIPVALRLRPDADSDAARAAVQSFAQAWRAGDLASVRYSGASGADVAKAWRRRPPALTPAAKDVPAAVDVLDVGDVGTTAPDTARAPAARALGAGRRPSMDLRDERRLPQGERRVGCRMDARGGPSVAAGRPGPRGPADRRSSGGGSWVRVARSSPGPGPSSSWGSSPVGRTTASRRRRPGEGRGRRRHRPHPPGEGGRAHRLRRGDHLAVRCLQGARPPVGVRAGPRHPQEPAQPRPDGRRSPGRCSAAQGRPRRSSCPAPAAGSGPAT